MPINRERVADAAVMLCGMERPFRSALLWHMEQYGTTIAELSRGAGVSEDVIKKLRTGHSQSTDVEKAMAIAGFYGKTIERFILREESGEDDGMGALAAMLTERERTILLSQIRAFLETRDLEAS